MFDGGVLPYFCEIEEVQPGINIGQPPTSNPLPRHSPQKLYSPIPTRNSAHFICYVGWIPLSRRGEIYSIR